MAPIDEKLEELVMAIDLLIEQAEADGHSDTGLIELLIEMQDVTREWQTDGSCEDRRRALATLADSFKAKLMSLGPNQVVLH